MFFLKTNLTGMPTGHNGFLSPAECETIINFGENSLGTTVAKTEDHQVHEEIRKSEISWLDQPEALPWLFDRIRACVNDVNAQWFGYNLIGFEKIQFTKYTYRPQEGPGFYASHKDTTTLPGGTIRKLSFTIQLSDPDTYGGGDVLLYDTLKDSIALSKAHGSISFFPSYTIHEVTPITRGVRYSLVGWAYGPAFV